MTTEEFEGVAKIFKETPVIYDESGGKNRGAVTYKRIFILRLAGYFADTNEGFSEQHFLDACGFTRRAYEQL